MTTYLIARRTLISVRIPLRVAAGICLSCTLLAGICTIATNRATASEIDERGGRQDCDEPCASCQKSPLTRAAGKQFEHDCVRAGQPHRSSRLAKPSRDKRDAFGYIGGNAAWRGEPRCADEGTWGLDYAGLFSKNHIWLKWLHGRQSHQRGGSYTTDGPHFLAH